MCQWDVGLTACNHNVGGSRRDQARLAGFARVSNGFLQGVLSCAVIILWETKGKKGRGHTHPSGGFTLTRTPAMRLAG